jgi:hypothetical protein
LKCDAKNEDLKRELAELREKTDERFQIVFETLDQLISIENTPKKKIGFTVKKSSADTEKRNEYPKTIGL